MPNTTVPAAGEAMPKNKMPRRSILKRGLAAALCGAATTAQAMPEVSTLSVLIQKHKDALAADRAAWEAASDLEDLPAMLARPRVRVQTSTLHLGRDDEGNQITEERYSYSEKEIRTVYDRHDMWKPGGLQYSSQPWCAARQAAHYERMDAKIAELHALEAECQKIEDECGHTAALAEARRLSEIVKGYEADIIAFVPTSLKDAVDKANWCVWAAEDDYCYLYDGNNLSGVLSEALAAIGRASA